MNPKKTELWAKNGIFRAEIGGFMGFIFSRNWGTCLVYNNDFFSLEMGTLYLRINI